MAFRPQLLLEKNDDVPLGLRQLLSETNRTDGFHEYLSHQIRVCLLMSE